MYTTYNWVPDSVHDVYIRSQSVNGKMKGTSKKKKDKSQNFTLYL